MSAIIGANTTGSIDENTVPLSLYIIGRKPLERKYGYLYHCVDWNVAKMQAGIRNIKHPMFQLTETSLPPVAK